MLHGEISTTRRYIHTPRARARAQLHARRRHGNREDEYSRRRTTKLATEIAISRNKRACSLLSVESPPPPPPPPASRPPRLVFWPRAGPRYSRRESHLYAGPIKPRIARRVSRAHSRSTQHFRRRNRNKRSRKASG